MINNYFNLDLEIIALLYTIKNNNIIFNYIKEKDSINREIEVLNKLERLD